MSFLRTPHLPEGKVRLCAVSAGAGYITTALERLGVGVIRVEAHSALPEPVAEHADMLVHDLGGGDVLVTQGCGKLAGELTAHGFRVRESGGLLGGVYPRDIRLNCFALGGVLYGSIDRVDPIILERYPARSPVRQGYAKCSACIVDESAIITADGGICAAAEKNGVETLLVQPGFVELPGYDYGFLGGCCGLLGKGLLAFTGSLDAHPDGDRIRVFCEKRGVGIVPLASGPLVDIGGILPLIAE